VTLLNAQRVLRGVEDERQRVALNQLIRQADIAWHGVRLHEPDWRLSSHSVALTARLTTERLFVHVILNAYWEPLEFELPSVSNGGRHPWRRWIDTFLESPNDIVEWEQAPSVPGRTYRTEPRSVVVLFAGLEHDKQDVLHILAENFSDSARRGDDRIGRRGDTRAGVEKTPGEEDRHARLGDR